MRLNLDFYLHWLWTVTFGLLTLTGFALMGARYGWILNYSLTIADYLHRTLAALFVCLLAAGILMEILRINVKLKVNIWMMVGQGSFQMFTLITTLLLILSGMLIWVCMEFSMQVLTFSLIVHELVSFIALGSLIWHIYLKSHALRV